MWKFGICKLYYIILVKNMSSQSSMKNMSSQSSKKNIFLLTLTS